MSEPIERRLRRALSSLDDVAPSVDLVAAARAQAARPARKTPWLLLSLGATAASVAAIAVVAMALRREVQRPITVQPPLNTLVVLDVRGAAWQGEGATRQPLRPGDRVASDTPLLTEDGARATFLDAGASMVTLSESTRAHCRTATADVTRVEVVRGVVRVEARLAAVPLIVSVAGLDDTMRLEDGSVGVVAGSGGGTFAVLDGSATLDQHGILQTVRRGHEITASSSGGDASTSELVLALAPVPSIGVGAQSLTVTGETKPGVLVTVNGRDVVVDETGHFSAVVTVDATRRRIVITARDALDRSRRAVLALRRDAPKEPRERPTETHWEWERTPG